FVDLENHFLKGEKLNFIAGDALVNPGDGPHRPEDMDNLVAIQVRPQDAIEADKMIHVMMRNEDRLQIGQALGVEVAQLAGVEKQGIVLAGIIDVQKWVAGGTVDQSAFRNRAGA